MNHSKTLRAMRAPPPSALLCSSSMHHHSSFLLLAKTTSTTRTTRSIKGIAAPNRRPASSLASQHSPGSSSATPILNPRLNPPASSRPAPLELPARQPDQSTFSHLFAQAKAYIKFYKGGMSAVFSNRRLLKEIIASKSSTVEGFRPPSIFAPGLVPKGFTRADWVLLWRVRHDVIRVPLFGLVLIVCGELTPLIVIFVDGVVPYTCRLPRQLAASFAQAEERRRKSFLDLERAVSSSSPPQGALPPSARFAARKHVLRSLHLPGMMWDKLGFVPPGMWETKGLLRMAFLEGDDALLARDGGAVGLEEQELRIACTERGIDCIGREDGELRNILDEWLRLTEAEETAERRKRMTVLLTTRTENWPKHRGFALPEWHL